MDYFKVKNRIRELRSLIASNWPDIEERKKMYKEIALLESELKEEELKETSEDR